MSSSAHAGPDGASTALHAARVAGALARLESLLGGVDDVSDALTNAGLVPEFVRCIASRDPPLVAEAARGRGRRRRERARGHHRVERRAVRARARLHAREEGPPARRARARGRVGAPGVGPAELSALDSVLSSPQAVVSRAGFARPEIARRGGARGWRRDARAARRALCAAAAGRAV